MSEIVIQDLIAFLEKEGYRLQFTGSEQDTVDTFSTLFSYKRGSLTFVSTLNQFSDYAHLFIDQKIQLVLIGFEEEIASSFVNTIQVEKPKYAFFAILEHFFSETEGTDFLTSDPEMYDKHAQISKSATIGKDVKIGANTVIEGNVVIGDNTTIHHHVVIRAKTKIGENCVISSGVVIGESGFNPLKTADGKRKLVKHYGGVTIGDDVHIGDNCTISKGTIDDTVIERGAKLNKQVVIAHNVTVGEDVVVTTPAFIGGSVQIGAGVHVAASVIRNQCKIGAGATLGLGSVVVKDVAAGETVVGVPARPMNGFKEEI